MYRRGQNYDDGESLQADVMRFMAIIAFCLIAILALVKHAEPHEKEAVADSQPEPQPANAPQAPAPVQVELALAPPPVAPQPALSAPEPRAQPEPEPIVADELEVEPEPEPAPVPEPDAPAAPSPLLEEKPVITAEPAPEQPEPDPVEAPAPPTAAKAETATEPEDEGLILRFASDGDFLRLIARGDIRVYAFQDTDVLTLSESYRFLDSQSPGQVYELLPPSIPNLIVDALKQARSNIDGYRWGIALPGHISNQIERHLGQVTRGQLVIDRYGDVHHVAAS